MGELAAKKPGAIVCGPSAAAIWNLIPHVPEKLWVAAKRGSWKPRLRGYRWLSWSGDRLWLGVTDLIVGVPVYISDPARATAELFAYRRELGELLPRLALWKLYIDPVGSYYPRLLYAAKLFRVERAVNDSWGKEPAPHAG